MSYGSKQTRRSGASPKHKLILSASDSTGAASLIQ
jgi:hypothetical protein